MLKQKRRHLLGVVTRCRECLRRTTALIGLLLSTVALFLLLLPSSVSAVTSNTINFQARLERSSGAIAADGTYNVEFKLYSASSGGTALWTEDWLNSNGQGVSVRNGYLTVSLGSITAFPSSINWDQQLYLTMNIGGVGATPSWDGEMAPRLLLTAVPYAFRAGALASTANASGYESDFVLTQPASGVASNETFTVADQGSGGSYTVCVQGTAAANGGCAPTTGGSGYIQNQSSSSQAANYWISGTGKAATLQGNTSVVTPVLDTVSSGSLSIGTTNATGIAIGKTGITTQIAGTLASTGNLTVTGTPPASSSGALVQLGNPIASGSASGTYLSVNAPSGSTADLLNLENSGASEFKVTSVGNTTIAGSLAVTGALTASNFSGRATGTNTGDVTLSGAASYLSLSGQVLSQNAINLGTVANLTGTLQAGNGGTGQSSYTIGDLLYASGSAALSKLNDVATGSCLVSGGVGVAPSWGACGSGPTTLQSAYTNSVGGTTPEIVEDPTRTTLDIQGYSGQSADLLDLRSYASSGLGTLELGVSPSGNITISGSLTVNGTGVSSIAGNFGIGTTSPGARLAVNGGNNIDPDWPDGLAGTPLFTTLAGNTYTVPSGETLYLEGLRTNGSYLCLGTTCTNSNEVTEPNGNTGYVWTPPSPMPIAAGTVINDSPNSASYPLVVWGYLTNSNGLGGRVAR